jgi:glycosyltransferase involved in cell wall biosynthesis
VRDRLCQELGFAPERTLLVENGVDIDAFAGARETPGLRRSLEIDDGRRIVACVGRLARGKNQDVLIRAMRRVRVAFPDAMLLLVGDGPLRPELEALVAREELQEGVRFARERTDVAEVLAASEVFVLPSDAEGIPLSLIEAMAAAKPVVATRVPGNVDVIRDPAFGALVPPRDPDALAMAIESLLSDPERARKLGSAGQAHVRSEFDIRATLARLERIYDEVLEERARRSP